MQFLKILNVQIQINIRFVLKIHKMRTSRPKIPRAPQNFFPLKQSDSKFFFYIYRYQIGRLVAKLNGPMKKKMEYQRKLQAWANFHLRKVVTVLIQVSQDNEFKLEVKYLQ